MGYDTRTLQVIASVSSHNSEQDRLDEVRWEELYRRISEIVAEYSDLGALI